MVADPEGPTNNRHYRETRQCRRLDERPRPVASSARRAPPPAFLFPKSTMSKSWFKIRNFRSDPNPPRRPSGGPPGVGSAVSIEPRTPCQRPASDFVQRFCSPVWKATAFRPGAQQDRRRCRPLDARWRLLWNRHPNVNRVFQGLAAKPLWSGYGAQISAAAPKARPSQVPSYPERTRNMTRFRWARKG